MKIRCEKKIFCDAVSIVSRAVSSRSSLPALEGILIRTRNNQIELVGYDLDTGITTAISAQIDENGEILLPAKVLLDISKRMPGEFISISVGEKSLTEIKSGEAEYTILGMSAEEFPEFPNIGDSTSFQISQNILRSMIDQTLFAVSQSDAKPVHTGSLFELSEDNTISVVSVDGYRLALRKESVQIESPLRFIVPGRALSEVIRILQDNDNLTQVSVSRKHIIFKIGEYQLFSRLLEGDFLDYKAAIPKGSTLKVKVNTDDFIESIERVGLLISDRVKSPLKVKVDDSGIIMTCSTSLGRAYDRMTAKIDGESVEIGFNNRYLIDALRNADCDEVQLEISGPLSPMKVVPANGDHFLFLVLPVRLKAD